MKSLYSLILNDEVIKRIDAVADASGTNRSNLINRILAEYVSYTTSEMRIQGILSQISDYLSKTEMVLLGEINGTNSLQMKTSLDYKYHPTVRYCVDLFRQSKESIGQFKVLFRINSQELLYNITRFFDLYISIEQKYIKQKVTYTLSPGKFIREFIIHNSDATSYNDIARAISDYMKNFDSILKKFLSGKYVSVSQMENDYKIYLSKSILI